MKVLLNHPVRVIARTRADLSIGYMVGVILMSTMMKRMKVRKVAWDLGCGKGGTEYVREAQISSIFSQASKKTVIKQASKQVMPEAKNQSPVDREEIIAAKRARAASATTLTTWMPTAGKSQPTTVNDHQTRNVLRHRLGVGGRGECPHCKQRMTLGEDLFVHLSTCSKNKTPHARSQDSSQDPSNGWPSISYGSSIPRQR